MRRANQEELLLPLLVHRCFQIGEITLSSGKKSDFYVDMRQASMSGLTVDLLGDAIWKRIKALSGGDVGTLPVDAIGGLAMGSIPLTTSAVRSAREDGRSLEGFWVRPEAKDHGTVQRIEGFLLPGARVVILDDVATSGQSFLKAIEAVQGVGCEVIMVLAVVDRLDGCRELLASHGIYCYQSIFTRHNFPTWQTVGGQ